MKQNNFMQAQFAACKSTEVIRAGTGNPADRKESRCKEDLHSFLLSAAQRLGEIELVQSPAPEVEAGKTASALVISVRDLVVVEKEGRAVLQTQGGMPLTNAEGRPYLASELGKVLSNDGRLSVSPSGRIFRPQNSARTATSCCGGSVIAGNREDRAGREETISTSIDSALTRRSKTWLERSAHEESTRLAVNCMQFSMESVSMESILRSIAVRESTKTTSELIGAC